MSLRRAVTALAIAAAIALIGIRLLLPAAGRMLVEADPPASADAIVVLAGSYPDRILEAVEIYKEGRAPRIIICREPDTAGFRRLAELGVAIPRPFDVNRQIAERLGVPPAAIEVMGRAGDSTYSEAQTVLDEAVRRGYRRIILVTSKYHTRRAGEIFRAFARGQLEVIVRPARDDDFQPEGWWRDRISRRRVIIEYQKLLNFLLVDRWRVAPIATPAATP